MTMHASQTKPTKSRSTIGVAGCVIMSAIMCWYSVNYVASLKNDTDVGMSATTTERKAVAVSKKGMLRAHYNGQEVPSSSHKESCLDPNGPAPVILMTRGRSGSSAMWQLLGNLTGYETKSFELIGQDPIQSRNFFEKIDENDDGDWLIDYMCSRQQEDPNAKFVGFKWKPFQTIHSTAAIRALERAAQQANPPVRIVRSRRNPLDVMLSKVKHRESKDLHAHCKTEECMEEHLKIARNLRLDTSELLEELERVEREEREVDELLEKIGVPVIDTTYEKLFYPEEGGASEWNKVVNFLDVGTEQEKTWSDVTSGMKHLPTSVRSHAESIANFEEVRDLLKGTQFETLLHI